jgi:hypothetical protein
MSQKKNEKSVVKRQQTYDLNLTKFELLHIRDLMGVLLPPEGETTLSRSLAAAEGRELIESSLWRKVADLCSAADLPLGSEAPDYIVIPISHPKLGVFQVNHEADDSPDESSGFLPNEEEDVEGEQ